MTEPSRAASAESRCATGTEAPKTGGAVHASLGSVTVAAGSAVAVLVPASSANLGPGFDSVGLALGVFDELAVTVTDEPGLRVEVTGEDAATVPRDERHLVVATLLETLDRLGAARPQGLLVRTHNVIPHGRGLGSSAAAIVAGVVAAQALIELSTQGCDIADGACVPVDLEQAADLASAAEGHPDNATASVYGGATLSWTDDDPGATHPTRTLRLTPHPDLAAVVLVPEATLATKHARAALPASVPLADAARNTGRGALLATALTQRPDLLLAATRDWLHQEARRPAYAPSMAVVDQLRAGGHAATISGAGPSVLVLTTRPELIEAPRDGWRRLAPGVPDAGVSVRRNLPALPRD